MTNTPLDELGPVDYVIVEFPDGHQHFTGEVIDELLALVEAGTIRVIDVLILAKDAEGAVEAMELADVEDLGPLVGLEAELAELLAESDVEMLAAAMDPGSVAGVLVYENLWAAPFALSCPTGRWRAHRQRPHPDPSHHRRRRSRRGPRSSRSLTCRCAQDA